MTKLEQMLTDYPETVSEKKMLKGLIADFFSAEPQKKNVYWAMNEEDIIMELVQNNSLDIVALDRYIMKLTKKHGISKKVAEKAIMDWCHALQVSFDPTKLDKAKKEKKRILEEKKKIHLEKMKNPEFEELDTLFEQIVDKN